VGSGDVARKKSSGSQRSGGVRRGARYKTIARPLTKPGSRSRKSSRVDAAEQNRLAEIQLEREALARIVASVLRMARQDKDVKQAVMGHRLGRSPDAISNMENLKTDISFPDTILWVIRLNADPAYLDTMVERLMFEIRKYYERRAASEPPTR
jgi:hypothetical protein